MTTTKIESKKVAIVENSATVENVKTAKAAKVENSDFLKSLNLKKVTEKKTYAERAEFISKFIETAKYNQKQLSDIMNAVFVAHTKAANNTLLVDSKNVLYFSMYKNLKNIVVVDKTTNCMSFANYSDKKIAEMRAAAQAKKVADKAAKTVKVV